ncbi:enterochelin esterase [Xenorhabdus bovienii]|uniref:Ferric enterobactin esterase n=1 Tax=Xenorhabdus bovienii str. kraussei Quebec TaxID=1398203 RepID=A0A077P213_XENBV|nr:enterochelin esterase [Xenorhabdus bovienii]MDE9534111.1 enterochelin esterase [Xenorhabdus bovienii]MDE9587974.1 enterochelin esterase [Xenorhabdus bovienii]CDH18465.1 ferric enterobactin esterase [Xenorhabdus bovienii str. kraussei Quebec]
MKLAFQPSGTISNLLSASYAGSELWWEHIAALGTPLVEARPKHQVQLTFFWRDPAGNEQNSDIRRVYIDINGITDHHSPQPQSLQRLPESDIWYWSVTIDDDWRGSYSLIPATHAHFPPDFYGDTQQRNQQQREWWCSLFPLSIPDPLNLQGCHRNGLGMSLSAAHMPHAPEQSAWASIGRNSLAQSDTQQPVLLNWQSHRLGNQRRIWLYATGEETERPRPLVILLDGQNWAERTPIFSALEAATEQQHIPGAVWLLIDVIDMSRREQELPCNRDFWLAVQDELLPLAAQHATFSDSPNNTVVAGQSYGGLAALYAALHWPQRFGCVLTQSGSFWWPYSKMMKSSERQTGWLTQQVIEQKVTPSSLKIFQEAGSREDDIEGVNQQMYEALKNAGYHVSYRVFNGGHDSLCWRGGLIDGLSWLLSENA